MKTRYVLSMIFTLNCLFLSSQIPVDIIAVNSIRVNTFNQEIVYPDFNKYNTVSSLRSYDVSGETMVQRNHVTTGLIPRYSRSRIAKFRTLDSDAQKLFIRNSRYNFTDDSRPSQTRPGFMESRVHW